MDAGGSFSVRILILARYPHSSQRLEFYYMINYYFKYIELFDTVFLALKKKPLGVYSRSAFWPHSLNLSL